MKIYDCFTFYNELDLLELRLTELYDYVDYFVIVEGDSTFTGKDKPFFFEKNRDRYRKWLDKIIYIKVDLPRSANAWDNEQFQRDSILKGIQSSESDDDLIVISDLDEIPRPAALRYIRDTEQTIYAFRVPLFNFKLNYMRTSPGQYDIWIMAGRRSVFREITPDQFRSLRFNFFGAGYQFKNNGCEVIEHGGWHFGYLGDRDYLIDKAQSFSHTEVNTPEFLAQIDPEASIRLRTSWKQDSQEHYEIVQVDSYFPRSIDKYLDKILPDSRAKALDFLPAYPYNV